MTTPQPKSMPYRCPNKHRIKEVWHGTVEQLEYDPKEKLYKATGTIEPIWLTPKDNTCAGCKAKGKETMQYCEFQRWEEICEKGTWQPTNRG
jgi:hypothetical protein